MADPSSAAQSRIQPVPPVPFPDRARSEAHLPLPLTSFVGRNREIAEVAALLRRPGVRLVTLTGPGGVGKSRLAIRAAEAAATAFPDGIWFVALAPVRDPTLVAATIAHALGPREGGTRTAEEGVRHFLRDRRALLVLDNLEHLLDAGPLIADLLSVCPRLAVLATSRAVLHLSGEHAVAVPPLSLPPGAVAPGEDGATASEAVQLFVERAAAARSDFVLTAADAPTVAAICAKLEGLPLAIELAAARVRALPPATLLRKLEHQLALLTGGGRDQPARLRSMRDAIAWSHDLLSPEDQVLFRRLAVFVGGFTLAAAEAIVPEGGDPGLDVFAGTASLVDHSLVWQQTGPGGEPRYLMLETVREYGWEQLASGGEAEAVRRRHAEHFATFADAEAAPILEVPDIALAFARVDAEQGNLRAALGWAIERGEPTMLLRLVEALRVYWHMPGRLTEGRAWTDRAVAVCEAAPAALRATARWEAAWFARFLGDHDRAEVLAQESLALARAAGDELATAKALYLLGFVAEDRGELPRALALHQEALRLLLPSNPPYWTAHAFYHVGRLSSACGFLQVGEAHLEEALARCRGEGHRYGPALVQSALAGIALKRGEHARAAALWQERLGLTWDAWGLRWCLEGLAEIAVASGEAERAARLLGAAEAARERLGVALVPGLLGQYEKDVMAARAALGEAAFAAAWVEGRQLSPEAARAEAANVAQGPETTATIGAPKHGLTRRELEVVRLVATGRSNAEVAAALFVSVPTVKRHLTTILAKLDLPSRSALTAHAHTHGLV